MNPQNALLALGFKGDLTLVLMTGALMMSRILPVIFLSPFLGGQVVPSEIKMGLGVVLSGVIFPSIVEQMHQLPLQAIPYISLLLKELFVGLSLAFVIDMVFQAAQVAGHVVDSVSGASNAHILVPQLGHEVTLFSSLKFQLAVVLFLTLDGHHLVITALADSFHTIPLNRFPEFAHGLWPFFDLIMHIFQEMMVVALAIAAPAFVASFLADLALGMINRVAPQVNVFFVSMEVKPLVVTIITLASIEFILERLGLEFHHMLDRLSEAIRLMA